MTVVLAASGSSFATRERARAVAAEILTSEGSASIGIDVSNIFASPSFLAEFLRALVGAGKSVTIVGADPRLAATISKLIGQLDLVGKVVVEHAALAR